MMMQNTSTGALEIYDISHNTLTSAYSVGAIGLNWQFAGVGTFGLNLNETDLLMRNSSTGALEVYDIHNNALANAYSAGAVGTNWTVSGIAALPTTVSSGASAGADASTSQLGQAMASYGTAGASNAASVPPLGVGEQLQQTLLTTPQA